MADNNFTKMVGGAPECWSSGTVENQSGKPASYTVGKSNDIVLHISSASLGAQRGDCLHFFSSALPMLWHIDGFLQQSVG